ncbi:cupin domain-containing protein [Actinacidiphila sp. DG2A-62]|uniref:cupin domain-containing protein n=1 Tax=Actinacidiphila sp. DG2A-62 TaxID=3108821 RepID=UPI002DBA2424|nr:cupin domain-containing protein [Actinacidiphila sp. DG2A-62]MEC3997081.1 cupin domain-containing protein [Actinacidiphila sp. DG2A-62]
MASETSTDRLQRMYEDFTRASVRPLWRESGLLPQTPRTITPHLWAGETIRNLAREAGALVPVEGGGDRRVLALAHPDLNGKPFATPTLWAGIQFLNGREAAPPHRHSPGALRFVMEGSGVWTMVNGDPVLMEPGDLVLTPSFNWHAHDNPSDSPMIWFDGLDLPMVQSLDAVFFEDGAGHGELYEASVKSRSEKLYGGVGLTPARQVMPDASLGRHSPLLAYRWKATDQALEAHLAESGEDSALLRFTDPTTGDDVMPTLRAEMLRIRRSGSTGKQRQVGSSVVLVHHGEGMSTVGDRDLSWKRGDVFVIPSWQAVVHRAHTRSDLFVLSDSPVLERIGLGRRELL